MTHYRNKDDQLNWGSGGDVVLANPQWIKKEPHAWDMVRTKLPHLGGHVWVSTSGTSAAHDGVLRWVALSQTAILSSAVGVNAHLQCDAKDVWIHALPLFHVAGIGILARAHLSGARIVPGTANGAWHPRAFYDAAAEYRATVSALVPTQLHDLVALGLRCPPTLRAVVIGGAKLDGTLRQEAIRLGWPCLASYGMTETCSQIATAPLGSVVDAEQPLVLLGHASACIASTGKIRIAGTSLLTCYAEISENVHVWDPKCDGWFETDDLGEIDGASLCVLGRSSDSVKVLGEKVYLQQIEGKIGAVRIPCVDFAIIALPHPRLGAELVLCIVGMTDPVETLLLDVNRVLLPYERLRRAVSVGSIPRTALGKARRALLAVEICDSQPSTDNQTSEKSRHAFSTS